MENFSLDKHVRYILVTYPVVILWMAGVLGNSVATDSDVYIFAGTVARRVPVGARIADLSSPPPASILAIAILLFVVRVALVTWRHYKHPLYKDCSMSPVEIALTQRKIFL